MLLEQLYYVSQIAAVVLILGSLVAIFLQQRQANAIARADMTQRAIAANAVALHELMTSRELAETFRKVMFDHAELSPVETTQISTYLNLLLTAHASAYFFVESDMIDPRYLDGTEHGIAWHLTAPVLAREWRRLQRAGQFAPDYAAYLNERFAAIYPDHDPASVKSTSATPDDGEKQRGALSRANMKVVARKDR